jgi:hypothetical protein
MRRETVQHMTKSVDIAKNWDIMRNVVIRRQDEVIRTTSTIQAEVVDMDNLVQEDSGADSGVEVKITEEMAEVDTEEVITEIITDTELMTLKTERMMKEKNHLSVRKAEATRMKCIQ